MKKKIAILGSTGSIGSNTVKIIENNKKDFEVVFLSTNKNVKKLFIQSIKLKPKSVIIFNKEKYFKFKKRFNSRNIKVFNNLIDLKSSIINKKIDFIMSSISGLDGLEPTLNSIHMTKSIAIANKESIICGWNLIIKKLNRYNTKFIPVDSEHFSIWSLLKNHKITEVEKVIITASGGPFLNYNIKKLKSVQPQLAVKHPNWKMGNKISIDSATLINKIFEIIEAQRIFNIDIKKFQITIHPDSYVHSIIKFNNGLIKILAHETDMKIPIFNSIYDSNLKKFDTKKINFELLNNLKFKKPEVSRYPCINILKYIKNKNSMFETVLVSANDELVDLYLRKKIKFTKIYEYLIKILKTKKYFKLINKKPKNLSDILSLSREVRLKTRNLCIK